MCAEGAKIPDDETAAFSRALAGLKQRGSNLLLVGTASGEICTQACQRLLGETVAEPRRRLLVYTDAGGATTDGRRRSLYAHPGADATKVIRRTTATRSANATAASPSTTGLPHTTVDGEHLSDLGAAITDAVRAFERASDGLEPAEFRLCFDSLLPLLAEHDRKDVFRFLHLLTGRVRGVKGMAHYHLPLARTAEEVALLSPLFDAVVEVRAHDGGPQQRWHLRDEGFTTDWLSL